MKIAENCLYANNLEEIESFYTEVLGLEIGMKKENRHIFFKCGDSMLLIFNPEHTRNVQTKMNATQYRFTKPKAQDMWLSVFRLMNLNP